MTERMKLRSLIVASLAIATLASSARAAEPFVWNAPAQPVGAPQAAPSWRSYAPGVNSVTGELYGYTVNSARYWQVGKNVTVVVDVTIVNAGTGGVGLVIDPPIPPASPTTYNGATSGFEVSTRFALAGPVGGSNITVYKYDGTYPGETGNRLIVHAVYVSQ